jgi:hypothetical protein
LFAEPFFLLVRFALLRLDEEQLGVNAQSSRIIEVLGKLTGCVAKKEIFFI